MIDKVVISKAPLAPGEERTLIIKGTGPFSVSERCFVFDPPPPRYESCEACSTRQVGAEEHTTIRAPADMSHLGRLELRIVITDPDGATALVTIPVRDREGDTERVRATVAE